MFLDGWKAVFFKEIIIFRNKSQHPKSFSIYNIARQESSCILVYQDIPALKTTPWAHFLYGNIYGD